MMKIRIEQTNLQFSEIGIKVGEIFEVQKEKDLYYMIKGRLIKVTVNFPKKWATVVENYPMPEVN